MAHNLSPDGFMIDNCVKGAGADCVREVISYMIKNPRATKKQICEISKVLVLAGYSSQRARSGRKSEFGKAFKKLSDH